jgi:hypothetical protein
MRPTVAETTIYLADALAAVLDSCMRENVLHGDASIAQAAAALDRYLTLSEPMVRA